jgi:hypothetical protein
MMCAPLFKCQGVEILTQTGNAGAWIMCGARAHVNILIYNPPSFLTGHDDDWRLCVERMAPVIGWMTNES